MSLLARDLMETRVLTVSPETPLVELDRKFLSAKVSGFPVLAQGHLVGVVSRSDVLRKLVAEQTYAEYVSDYYHGEGVDALAAVAGIVGANVGARIEGATVDDVMVRELITVPPDAPIETVARCLVERRVHRVLVTREDALLGIITSLGLAALIADGRARVA